MLSILRRLVPNKPRLMPILRGPFGGARVLLNPRSSFRKMFGLYEHELNPWLSEVLPRVKVVYDIGANDGYFTFGCMEQFRRHAGGAVYAFEPQAVACEQLANTVKHSRYATADNIQLEITQGFVGTGENGTISVDAWLKARSAPPLAGPAMVKIDVEGAELDVLRGAESLAVPGNYFLIEIHTKELLVSVAQFFRERNLPMRQVDQSPLPLLGRENREIDNWWLVTAL